MEKTKNRGDKGNTSLLSGERVEKTSMRVDSYGTLDELSATLGVAKVHSSERVSGVIESIQERLYYIGSELASSHPSALSIRASEDDVSRLEGWLKEFRAEIPPAKSFIIPGGSASAAFLHVSRTVCRRAERVIVKVSHEIDISPAILKYMNRLSDLLFELSRYVNIVEGDGDTIVSKEGIGVQRLT